MLATWALSLCGCAPPLQHPISPGLTLWCSAEPELGAGHPIHIMAASEHQQTTKRPSLLVWVWFEWQTAWRHCSVGRLLTYLLACLLACLPCLLLFAFIKYGLDGSRGPCLFHFAQQQRPRSLPSSLQSSLPFSYP